MAISARPEAKQYYREKSVSTKVLFIQGGGEGAYDEDKMLADSLQAALGAEYQVVYPPMPDEGAPTYEAWANAIRNELSVFADEFVVAGHSFGASILLKVFAETQPEKSALGTFLVAMPYWGAEDWEVDEYALSDDFAADLPNSPVYLYHSKDDEIAPFEHLSLYAEKLPHATVREFDVGGHQFNNDLSAVASDIRRVVEGS
jgi:predicted alpha/beta hydrolase family esterase